jgi:hypothetical protein
MPRPPHAGYSTAERAFARSSIKKLHQQKTCFLLSIKEVSSGRLTIPPCCIQREADELAALIFAAFALNSQSVLPCCETSRKYAMICKHFLKRKEVTLYESTG